MRNRAWKHLENLGNLLPPPLPIQKKPVYRSVGSSEGGLTLYLILGTIILSFDTLIIRKQVINYNTTSTIF